MTTSLPKPTCLLTPTMATRQRDLLDRNHPLVGQQAFHVVTGTQPSMRLHAYWQLAQPVRDMSAWRQAQKALIGEFQTDAAIHNPSRIMRLAGTISWPSADKRAKGYTPELVRLDRPGTPAPRVSMGTALAYARPAPRSPVSHPSASTFGLVAELKVTRRAGNWLAHADGQACRSSCQTRCQRP